MINLRRWVWIRSVTLGLGQVEPDDTVENDHASRPRARAL